jgi:hypothetical protein
MNFAKNILLAACFAGLALGQNKNAAPAKKPAPAAAKAKPPAAAATAKTSVEAPPKPPATAVTIPKDAIEIEPGLFQAKDDAGKVWHYTRTPFGVRRFEPENLKDTTAEEAARISVTGEENGVVRFVRKTPFGSAAWSKKRDKLNAAEKMALERSAGGKSSNGGGATATAKPAN